MFGVVTSACLTGDDVTAGDEPEARRVFDLRRPAAVRLADAAALGTTSPAAARSRAPTSSSAPSRTRGAPLAYRRRAGRQEGRRPAPASCSCRSLTARAARGLRGRGPRARRTDRCALLPTICLVSGDRALRFMDDRVPGIGFRRHDRADLAVARPRRGCYQLALEQARHALRSTRRRTHLTSFRRDNAIARLATISVSAQATPRRRVFQEPRPRDPCPARTLRERKPGDHLRARTPARRRRGSGARAGRHARVRRRPERHRPAAGAHPHVGPRSGLALVVQAGGRPILQMTNARSHPPRTTAIGGCCDASRRCCRCSAIPCRHEAPRCATSTQPASSRCSHTFAAASCDGLGVDALFLIGAAATRGCRPPRRRRRASLRRRSGTRPGRRARARPA